MSGHLFTCDLTLHCPSQQSGLLKTQLSLPLSLPPSLPPSIIPYNGSFQLLCEIQASLKPIEGSYELLPEPQAPACCLDPLTSYFIRQPYPFLTHLPRKLLLAPNAKDCTFPREVTLRLLFLILSQLTSLQVRTYPR